MLFLSKNAIPIGTIVEIMRGIETNYIYYTLSYFGKKAIHIDYFGWMSSHILIQDVIHL